MRSSPARASSLHSSRLVVVFGVAGLLVAFSGFVSTAAAAGGWDVCRHGCRYDQLGPALAASRDGDTIRIGPGVYAGGLTITTSVILVGAGKGTTVIRGGGPVLTIGTLDDATPPTVSIRGVTMTGGVSRTSSLAFWSTGTAGALATGGGIEVPPGPASPTGFGPGAAVSITDSEITWNRAAPSEAVPFGPPCPAGPCPFAGAAGGGIYSWGDLTLLRTSVSHNRVGNATGLSDLTSDAVGGGIEHRAGDLTISDSVLEDNQASAGAPNGRFAEGGAMRDLGRTMLLSRDVFRGNTAVLNAAMPDSVVMTGQGGAALFSSQEATIRDTEFTGNSATMTNTVGYSYANSGAVHAELLLTVSGAVFNRNSVVSVTLPGSVSTASGDSGAGGGGTVTNTRFTGNTLIVSSAAGDAIASGGATIASGSLTDSVVSANRIIATSRKGTVTLAGAGIQVGDFDLAVDNADITGNTGVAIGRSGVARGGGIANAQVPDGPPGGPLTLTSSRITGNRLTASPGIPVSGGGLFSTYPVTRTNSAITGNAPDQCVGC